MDLANSYYLWWRPDQPAFDRYHTIIKQLCVEYNTPCFEPHVTLVSGLSEPEDELIAKVAQLATVVQPITLTFDTIEYTHGFFTALYLKAQCTDEANHFNQLARQHLNPFGQSPYMPHMSLLYGNISEDQKQSIIQNLSFNQDPVRYSELQLVRGNADVTQWTTLGQWSLR